jgi:peptidoglycan/LPS O-acetylase OafA/YrhL
MCNDGRATASGFRPDLEGLRAVAVLFVVANHLGWLGGGFVGVDIFFVISGFLITGLLRDELERTGRISFVGFYRRRARRILPAAVCVLLVTNLAAHQVFLANRAH